MSLPIWFLLLLLPLLTLVAFVKFSRRKNDAKHKLPPGPAQLPFIGNLHQIGELIHCSLHKLSQKHGPLMYLKLGNVPAIVASSAETAEAFLKTHDLDCCSRPPLTSLRIFSYGFRDVAFSPYGDQWRELRKICILHLFSTKKVESFRSVREEEIERMVASISVSSSQGTQINLSQELLSLSNNITCRTALGKRFPGGVGRAYEMLREQETLFTAFFVGDYFPWLQWVDRLTGMRARLERNFRDFDRFYQQIIEEHRGSMVQQHGEEGRDALDALLNIQKSDTRHLTDEHIKGVLMNIFAAGSDTSSAMIEWAMTELIRNRQAMRKAQDEVRGVIGSKGKVEEDDLQQLDYLKLVVKETMRLHPPAPALIQRETLRDCEINGYWIPARTRLFINAWAIGRDKNIWERPHVFDPDRFANNTIDFRGHDFQLIPFGAGRRICPGMLSAILVVKLALANLLYLFDWKLPNGMLEECINMDEAPGITVHKKYPLHLVATKHGKLGN